MLIDTKVTEYPVTKAWEKGNEELKNGNRDDYFDLGIAYVAQLSMDEGLGDRDKIEGKTRKLWLTRFWRVGLENNNLLL
jgi:hypothetical protein